MIFKDLSVFLCFFLVFFVLFVCLFVFGLFVCLFFLNPRLVFNGISIIYASTKTESRSLIFLT